MIPCLSSYVSEILQEHQVQYPTLSHIARDYLAIQGSATPSERAFSSAGLTGTKLRNRLRPDIFEALQLLKGAYRNGHISAAQQAAGQLFDVMQALEEYDLGCEPDSEDGDSSDDS